MDGDHTVSGDLLTPGAGVPNYAEALKDTDFLLMFGRTTYEDLIYQHERRTR